MLELVAGTPEWTSQVLPSKVVLDWALDIVFKLDMDLWWLFISLIEDWLRGFLGGLFGGLEPYNKFITCFYESWIYETWICSMKFLVCLDLFERIKIDYKIPILISCYQNCFDILWERIVLVIEKIFWNSRLRICKMFEITRTICSNCERWEQFSVTLGVT